MIIICVIKYFFNSANIAAVIYLFDRFNFFSELYLNLNKTKLK